MATPLQHRLRLSAFTRAPPSASSSSSSSSPSPCSVPSTTRSGAAGIPTKRAGFRHPCRGLKTSRRSESVSGDGAAAARRRPALHLPSSSSPPPPPPSSPLLLLLYNEALNGARRKNVKLIINSGTLTVRQKVFNKIHFLFFI